MSTSTPIDPFQAIPTPIVYDDSLFGRLFLEDPLIEPFFTSSSSSFPLDYSSLPSEQTFSSMLSFALAKETPPGRLGIPPSHFFGEHPHPKDDGSTSLAPPPQQVQSVDKKGEKQQMVQAGKGVVIQQPPVPSSRDLVSYITVIYII
jgi:hypothetical protein